MSNNNQYLDRAWLELQNAAGNGTTDSGPAVDRWNSQHFLDVAEMTAPFAIAYGWLHDAWTAYQKCAIMSTMIQYRIVLRLPVFTTTTTTYWWWTASGINGIGIVSAILV
jgi:hypothetical protein